MIPIISKLLNWVISNGKMLAVIIIVIFSAIFVLQHNQLKQKNKEINRLQNNCLFYEEQAAEIADINRTLQFTVDDLVMSNDSIIKELNAAKKKLKIKDKELKQAQRQSQVIKYDTTIIVNSCDFVKEIKPNELTSIIINKKDSVLNTKINIHNDQTLFVISKKEYKRKYKNWLTRFFHFDFKKRTVSNYQIHNSNELIKTSDVRIIEITN